MAERERHAKYRRQDEEREVVRQQIREKVDTVTYIDAKCNTSVCVKYNIEKPATEDDEEEDEDDFAFGQRRLEDNQDAISSENFTLFLQMSFNDCFVHSSVCVHLFSLSLINIHSQLHLHINHLESLTLPLQHHSPCHKMMF